MNSATTVYEPTGEQSAFIHRIYRFFRPSRFVSIDFRDCSSSDNASLA